MRKFLICSAMMIGSATSANAATLVASYSFNNNLDSSVGGAQTLTVTDPQMAASFSSDTVNGNPQIAYNFGGANSPPSDQGGLTWGNGLISSSGVGYSIALTFKFNEGSNLWRRIVDVQARQSDNGLYIDPSNVLDIYPVTNGGPLFTTGAYHNVLLTVGGGVAKGYLDGVQSFSTMTNVMDLASGDSINLFLDNVIGGGQGEWSSGSIASANFYSGIVSIGGVPEPASWALMIAGFGLVGAAARRRQSVRVTYA